MKNVLMIAYYYPPQNNGGTPRPFQFAKYLPSYNYNPIVITTSNYGMIDEEKNVFRIFDPYLEIKNSFTKNFFIKILYNLGLIKAKNISWSQNVLKKIEEILKDNKIDIIWITYPPLISLTLINKIRRISKIPIVCDFRDGFVFQPKTRENIYRKLINKNIEKQIVRLSNYITTVTPSISAYYKNEYNVEQVMTITNGFDRELDFTNKKIIKDSEITKIVYTGRISISDEEQSIDSFIWALDEINKQYPLIKYQFILAGELSEKEHNFIKKTLEQKFIYLGNIPYKDSLELQENADLLLLLANTKNKDMATTKLYEYISANTPILALSKGTFAEKVINATKTGICLDSNDKGIIKKALENFLINREFSSFSPNLEEIEKYHRKNLTKTLANLFSGLLSD